MSAERLTLVADFAKLKAGDIIVAGPCLACGRKHRAILVHFNRSEPTYDERDGYTGDHDGWVIEPTPTCVPRTRPVAITRNSVASGRVFWIDTGLEQTEATEKAEPKSLERVR